jgi:cephalosporin hydroxylase
MSLTQYFWLNTNVPIHKWTYYLPIYERHFANFRNRAIVFLEIGSGQGGSSQMWKHYFGPAARIVTVDIRPECLAFEDEQVAVRIGDQSDRAFLSQIVEEFGAPDVVLDDGSHQMTHVCATFDYLYPRTTREAVYLVEDLHTSYWPEYQGGLQAPETFIERTKTYIDEMHARHTRGQLPETEIGRVTRAIHIYDSVVVFEKGPFLAKVDRSIPWVDENIKW